MCVHVCMYTCACKCVFQAEEDGKDQEKESPTHLYLGILGEKRFLGMVASASISCLGKTGEKTGKEAGTGSRWALSARPLS